MFLSCVLDLLQKVLDVLLVIRLLFVAENSIWNELVFYDVVVGQVEIQQSPEKLLVIN